MKTAISIPDAVYEEAERLARRLKKSRSQLYADAVREYLARYDHDEITEAMNRISDAIDTRLEPDLDAASRRTLARVEW